VAGALFGVVVAVLSGQLGYAVKLNDGLIWGAVIGGVLSGMPQFAQSGAVLTRSQHRSWNTAVGLGAGMAIMGALSLLVIFVLRLLS
jgi:hypothetical protein